MSSLAFTASLLCPHCEEPINTPLDPLPTGLECAACKKHVALHPEHLGEGRVVNRCLVCGNRELYIQKDFNRTLGCAVVLISVALAVPTNYISLFVGALIDGALYLVLPFVMVCYRCRSVFRGYGPGHRHGGYHPERAAKYDEYLG